MNERKLKPHNLERDPLHNSCEVSCQTFFAYFFSVASGSKQRAVCAQVIKLLREERVKRGISKYALSAQCGLAQQTISYVERGLRQPSFETVLRIADGIGVSLEDVLKRARALK
ncbi:MAG TPA: helix-turn-helix transcriptional regulator [Verrucomicrobiae bacterium]|nr:helix-turn-helix transcriptional regulator [Verrucomicrobiae bacterium]